VTGTAALATIIALCALHFAASGHLLDRYVETTTDPILAARQTVNGLLVSVAGLIAVAVANELVIAHPHGQASVALSLLWFGGPLLYLLSQTVYLWAVIGTRSLVRAHIQANFEIGRASATQILRPPACPPSTRLLPEAL
jgi:low temperature requirement protein LtrA